MGYLVDHHPDLIRAEYGLSEGGGTTMYVAGREFYDVRTAEKGTCRFVLRASGQSGHGSIPRPDTAVERLSRGVLALSTSRLPFRPTPTAAHFFEGVCEALGFPGEVCRLTEHNLERVVGHLPVDLRQFLLAITRDTAVPTGLRAGQKINVIPSDAEARVDGRFLPGQTAEGFLHEVQHVLGQGYEIEPFDVTAPLEDPPGDPLYRSVVEVMGRHAPQAGILPTMLSGATDAKHVARLGTRCLGFGPLRVPPGFPSDSLVHGHDERIPIDGYVWGVQVLHDIVREFCGG
jgi:acetylornithine deacetylase/succinyl-diaminopimelate desuccinylase-like protein